MKLGGKAFIISMIVIVLLTTAGCRDALDKMEVYALMGQSNMAGRGKIDSTVNAYMSSAVLMVTQEDTIDTAKHPLHFDKPAAGVGPGLKFGHSMYEKRGPKVILVPCAVGGTSIKLWKPGIYDEKTNTHPYDDAIERLEVGMKFGELKGVI